MSLAGKYEEKYSEARALLQRREHSEEKYTNFIAKLKKERMRGAAGALIRMVNRRKPLPADFIYLKALIGAGYIETAEDKLMFNPSPKRGETPPWVLRDVGIEDVIKRVRFGIEMVHGTPQIRQVALQLLMIYGAVKRIGQREYEWVLSREGREKLCMSTRPETEGNVYAQAKKLVVDADMIGRSTLPLGDIDELETTRNRIVALLLISEMTENRKELTFTVNLIRNSIAASPNKTLADREDYSPQALGKSMSWLAEKGALQKMVFTDMASGEGRSTRRYRLVPEGARKVLGEMKKVVDRIIERKPRTAQITGT